MDYFIGHPFNILFSGDSDWGTGQGRMMLKLPGRALTFLKKL